MRARTYLPRAEYPRPDLQRAFVHGVDWLNLNGPWEFRFDPDKAGRELRWFEPGGATWAEQIIVPFCWESLAAWGESEAAGNDYYYSRRVFRNPLEVDRFNYRRSPRYEVGWYRREVTIPVNDHWLGKRVILTIGAADFSTDLWCNGQHLGAHEGGYIPFEFDLTDALERTADGRFVARLVVRVEDPMDNREQPVGKQWGWYSSASGIWQTVFLEPRAAVAVERFEIVTQYDRPEAQLKVFTNGGTKLAAEVTNPSGGKPSTHQFTVNEGVASGSIPLSEMLLWEPNHPHLYQLKLTLGEGPTSDVVHSYFGVRSLSAAPAEEAGAPAVLSLNGEPIYIRGALYQSYHTEGIYTAGDVQALKDDIAAAKRFGFDLLRVHIKVDDPLLLHYADTMGILLMADFPNFGEGGDTPRGRQRFETMMRAAIRRDFNHPSIVAWCLFNETWGFGGQAEFVKLINPQPASAGAVAAAVSNGKLENLEPFAWVEKMWHLAKSLDSTRLVEDMSVVVWDHLQYYGHGSTDVNSWHFYTDSYERARTHIAEVVAETHEGSSFNYVPGFEQGDQPLINSEYGGVGALDGDRDTSWSFKFLTNELRRHGKLSAYIYTELHDVEWECNGFLNYDRTPKEFGYDPTVVNQGDVLPIDAPPISRCTPGQELSLEVLSSHFSRVPRKNVTLFWRLSGIDALGWIHDDLASGEKPISFRRHRVELAERIALRLPECQMLCTLWVRALTEDGHVVARNFVQFFVDAGLRDLEENDGRIILRAAPHTWRDAWWSGASSDRGDAEANGRCFGRGFGHFEWLFPLPWDTRGGITRIRILCEVSAHRESTPQTDSFASPTTFCMLLNGKRVYEGILPNHPHDANGSLSYLRAGKGAYGYLVQVTIEGELLRQVLEQPESEGLWLRCLVAEEAPERCGLTIYGADCGRYPVPLTVVIERG